MYKYIWFIGMILFEVFGIMYAIQGDPDKAIACSSFGIACCANFRISLLEEEKK